ncbi:SWF or SNF family helicase [Streptomyces lydicus]|nr:SWF or SNF family helicase [Streptomyces lydicus]
MTRPGEEEEEAMTPDREWSPDERDPAAERHPDDRSPEPARHPDDRDPGDRDQDGRDQDGRYPAAGERTFGALPPARGRAFARSWWGQAWLKALEDTALDGGQLKLGRRHARAGAVGAVAVRPGRITAVVQDSDHTRHRSDVLLQQLDVADWDRLLDLVADRAGHIAALLDRDMPPVLVEDASAAGIELLPGIGDLEAECSCGAWDHCAHTAALCYQLARLLDQDPFVLLLLRGRGERELLDALQARSAARAAGPAGGVGATGGDGRRSVPLRGAGGGGVCGARHPAAAARDAAAGRHAGSLAGARRRHPPAPGVEVGPWVPDRGRGGARPGLLAEALCAGHRTPRCRRCSPPPRTRYGWRRPAREAVSARLAAGSGRDARALALAVRAWELGGPAGLAVLEEDWAPEPEALARATGRLAAAWEDGEVRPRLRATRNRWTAVGGGLSCATGGTAAGGRIAGRTGSGRPRARPRTIRRAPGRCCRPRGEVSGEVGGSG